MLRPGQIIFLCALSLLVIGVVMVTSAGMKVDPVEVVPVGPPPTPDDVAHSVGSVLSRVLLGSSALYMVLAVLAMSATSVFPIKRLAIFGDGAAESDRGRRQALAVIMLGVVALVAVLALPYVPGLGRTMNGSQRWISFPVPGFRKLSFQPSELAKWGLVVLTAAYCASRSDLLSRFWTGLLPGLLGVGVVAGAVAHEDLGTGVLMVAAAGVVLLAAGARLWQFLIFIPPAAAGLIGLIITSPYRVERLRTFVDPYLDPQGAGYHMIQSMAAVAGGEGFGRGLGFGLQKFDYLPEDTTDFLFAIICEELGIAGAAVVLSLYVALLWAGLAIVRRESSVMLKLLGIGVLATVGFQAVINLAVVTGLGPTKGIALPLVSSGGTGWILTAASLGLIIAMDRAHARRADAAEPTGAPEPVPQAEPALVIRTTPAAQLSPA